MTILQVIILSIVEGITEFIPISSTGHLILTTHLLKIEPTPFHTSFEIAIQVGAIGAVIYLYIDKILKNPNLVKLIFASFIPTAVSGLIFYRIIKNFLLTNVSITVWALIIGGFIIIIIEKILQKKYSKKITVDELSTKQAIIIGLAQAISIIPGVSRAGATMIGGLLCGLSRGAAVEYSFLLAVPTILAATLLDLTNTSYQFTSTQFSFLTLGIVLSFLSAMITIRFLLNYVKSNTLIPFGVYRIFLGLMFLFFIR